MPPEPCPDLADLLAAVNRFRLLEEADPLFYRRHRAAVRAAQAAVESWGSELTRPLFAVIAGAAPERAADTVRRVLEQPGLAPREPAQAERQLATSLRQLHDVCRDPALPHWLQHARAVIERCLAAAA